MRRLAVVVSVLGLMGLLVASGPAAFKGNTWIACALAATVSLALVGLRERGRGTYVGAALFLLVAAAGATALFSPAGTTRAAEPFTVHISPKQVDPSVDATSLWNTTYGAAKSEFSALQSSGGEVTIVFDKETGAKLTGLPALDGTPDTANAYFDDTNYDLTIIFDTTYQDLDAKVLVSARWQGTDDYYPELAVVIRFDSIDLGTLNSSWDTFPVSFSDAIVGFSNKDHTLVESATLGTTDFFEDGIADTVTPSPDNSFRIIPGGAALQAVLHDEPNEPDPLFDGAGMLGAVDTIIIRGTAGKIPGAEDDSTLKALDLTATVTVSTPPALEETGTKLDTSWSLQIKGDSSGKYFGQLSGGAKLNLDGTDHSFGAALTITYDKTAKTANFKLEGSVGDFDDLFGQTWLDLKQLKIAATVGRDGSKTPPQTTIGMTMNASLTLGGVSAQAALSAKTNLTTNESEFGLSLAVTEPVSIGDILTALGAPTVDDGWKVTLTNFGLHVAVKKPATGSASVTVAATGGAKILEKTCGGTLYPGGNADLLFRLQVGGGNATTFLVGASLSGLNVKNLSCDIPFDWTLPSVMLTAANSAINTNWALVDLPTKSFFENYFCPNGANTDCTQALQRFICPANSTIPCDVSKQALKVDQGLSVRALVTLDNDMKDALAKLSINVSGPLVITGTVPLFGATGLSLQVALPTITFRPDDLVAGGDVLFKIEASPQGVKAEITGIMDFRLQRIDQSACTDDDEKFTDGTCYDTLNLAVTIGIEATTTPPSVELTVDAFLSNWVNAFGDPNLTINAFALHLSIKASSDPTAPGVSLEIGMRGDLVIGTTDLQVAFLVEMSPTPPRILLKGLTLGSAKGINLRDIVQTFAPDLDEQALPPELSLKNLWLAYGTENNNTLCIRQGLFIQAELHLNDPDANSTVGTNPACGTNGVPQPNCGPSATSCLAGVQVDIGPKRFKVYGALGAFNLGPISFEGAELLIDLSLLKQEIYFKGAATLYDPILYYASDPDGTDSVWASGYIKLEVKQNLGVFSLGLEGCALLGGTAVADENCTTSSSTVFQAYVKGTIEADFKKVGLKFFEDATADFELELSAPALQKLAEDIGEQLKPVADFFDDAGTTIEGTANTVVATVEDKFCVAFNADCPTLNVTADAYSDAPTYINAVIDATDVAIRDNAALNFYCFATFNWPVADCVQDYRDAARAANNATIAANGGVLYIALHGIDATGFGGIRDADFPDVWYVNPTKFKWPAAGTPALCDQGGTLYGLSPCAAGKGETTNLDDLLGPVLLNALKQTNPALAALFESGDLSASQVAALALSQTAPDPGQFTADARKLGAAFDPSRPLAVCEAKTSIKVGPETGFEGSLGLTTKIDAFGGKSIDSVKLDTTTANAPKVDRAAVTKGVIDDVLKSAVSDLQCPVATASGTLSFSMSASTINEGDTLTLTGKAPAGAVVTIQWGDGSANAGATADANGDWTASHKYVDGPATRVIKATAPNITPAASVLTVNNVAPTITSLTPPPAVNEGEEVSLSGTFSDPGTLDTQVVTVDWGDGSAATQQALAAGSSTFSLKHTYVDDDPTGTAQDTYAIKVTIRDKDKGTDTESTSAVVKNVAPYDLKLTSATWSGGQATTDGAGNLVVPEGTSVTWTGTFRDPGLADAHNIVIDWGDGNFESATPTRDAQDPTLVTFEFTHIFADDHPATGTPSDLVQMKIQVRDDDAGTAETEPMARVANVAPAVSVAPATQDVQYSDPVAKVVLTATDVRGIVGPDQSLSETLQASTRWKVDDGAWQDGLFGDLSWSADGCEVSGLGSAATQTCTWSVEGLVKVAPGTYVIEFTVVDDDTGKTVKTATIVVLPEDARATYTGPTVISAPSLANGSVDIMLRATVRDISVVPGINPPDDYPGDITNAKVKFVDRSDGATLCEAPVVPIFAGNTTTGGASCVATLALPAGQSSHTINVGVVAGGWYLRDDASEDTPVTLEKPTGDWVTGGDSIIISGGVGAYAPGSNPKVTLSTAWAMPGLSGLTGSLRVRFASGGRQYQLDVTSFDSVGTIPGASSKLGQAQIEARATLFDITDSVDNPVTVATNLRLQFRVSDTGGVETASFAAWAENGLLVAASAWDQAFVPETNLVLGKLQVHFD